MTANAKTAIAAGRNLSYFVPKTHGRNRGKHVCINEIIDPTFPHGKQILLKMWANELSSEKLLSRRGNKK
jgi:hypothetical protein